MKRTVQITGVIDSDMKFNFIKTFLEKAGMTKINFRTLPQFDDWQSELPKESIPGLSNDCLDWIRHWGNGGGDQSSETCISDAIKNLNSENPAELADAILESVSGYSKSEFDAIGLTIEMIDSCIEEIMAERREIELNYEEDSQ